MLQITKVQLSGLTCDACKKMITNKLKTITDVQKVHVTVQNGTTVIVASRLIGVDEVTQTLAGTHYKVIKNDL